ncbi:MAG: hypothetical protein ACE5I1_16900 [bacterium]
MSEELQSAEKPKNTSNGLDRAIFGLILVLVGVIFMLRNVEIFELDNWWALFILIPAIASFGNAWSVYKNSGRQMTRQVRSRIVGGLFPLTIALIFLFGLDMGELWPVFIILAGVAVILS